MPTSAPRYYEEKGLIPSVGQRGLRRLFDASVLERLALIALGQVAGFSLDEIADMFTPDGRPQIDRKTLASKADGLDRTIQQLSSMRDGLRHASVCPAPSHMECPSFRRLMQAAAGLKGDDPRQRSTRRRSKGSPLVRTSTTRARR